MFYTAFFIFFSLNIFGKPNHSDTTLKTEIKKNETKETSKKQRTITIKNNIDDAMLTVKKFGTHNPSKFSVSIAEKPLKTAERRSVTLASDTITVHYEYEFAKGLYSGKGDVTFDVPQKTDTLSMTFSWQDPNHVIFDHATPIAVSKKNKKK